MRDGDRALLVAAEFADAALALGLLEPGGLARLLRAGGDGGHTAVVALTDDGARLHLRAIRHRGLLGPALADRLLGLRRPAASPVSWIAIDTKKASGTVTERPTRDAIPIVAQEQLIVELYSK